MPTTTIKTIKIWKMRIVCILTLAAFTSHLYSDQILNWSNVEGVQIQGRFVRLENDYLTIIKDNKEFKVDISKLSESSQRQAREMAELQIENQAPIETAPPKSFGKQKDPDHQRKLAESMLQKKAAISILQGSKAIPITDIEQLPAGKITIQSIEATQAPFSDEDAVLLNGCEKLEKLAIYGASLEAMPFESLSSLSYLETRGCRIDTAAYRGLRNSKTLTIFAMPGPLGGANNEITSILATCPNLKFIDLYSAGLMGSPLQDMTNLQMLDTLKIGGSNQIDPTDLDSLAKLPSLMVLDLSNMDLTATSFDFLVNLKSVQRLYFHGAKLPENAFEKISKMRSLTLIWLLGSNVSEKMLSSLSGHKTLTGLVMSYTSISGESFSGFKPIPTLRDLYLNEAPVTEAGLQSISNAFPSLVTLEINGASIGKSGFQNFEKLKKIQDLRIIGPTRIDRLALVSLNVCKSLSKLSLTGAHLDSNTLMALADLRGQLEYLDISDTNVDDASIEGLSEFKLLKHLNIKGTKITNAGKSKISDLLVNCEILY
jgi:Leucine-rich repeat (LRR) protein